ncbi:MAG: RNA polymerase sigma factor [Saprospiraceae bacterium]|nr:RNA polymerase sigma factor [Saprospiraceae bacterium]MCF8251346.1 RNA polymerase sigma factor [Saprospiraceae bacterium]MCF8280521.1 RNA polymerase sigma factor [Bacteroidales bacterium]MCF8313261.1 RNA polymerase sigma factor [Saprospiraceae bacterium]MCF8441708.1 RNA polymerase sigma factor [Saprospiraceae bacterium]
MQEITVDSAYLAELRKGSPKAFEELYNRYFRMVEDMVFKFNGSTEDARDVFQEALFVFVKKLRDPDFVLTSKASTFIYAIARNLYLKKAGKATVEISMDQQQFSFFAEADPVQGDLSPAEKDSMLNLMADKLGQLEEDCRAVITYSFYQGLSHAQIAELTGYTEAFVKVKKFRCLEYLRKLVKASEIFKNL